MYVLIVYALVFFSLMQFMNGTCGSVEYSSTTLLHEYVEFCSLKMPMIFFFFLVYLTFKRMNLYLQTMNYEGKESCECTRLRIITL